MFLTLSLAVVNEINTQKVSGTNNPFHHWIVNKLKGAQVAGSAPIPVVLLLPNLDSWIFGSGSTTDVEGIQTEDTYSSKSTRCLLNISFLQLQDAIAGLSTRPNNAIPPVKFGVIATATTMDDLFVLTECRQLFHRRLLVTLPDAHTRYHILRHFILSRLAIMFSDSFESNLKLDQVLDLPEIKNDLVTVASKLHGYTPKCVNFYALMNRWQA